MTEPPVAQAPVAQTPGAQERTVQAPAGQAHVEAERVGVLVMAHGTPAAAEEIEPFYTRIRRGRPPTPEQLADLRRRYDAIGGTSPLAARTAAQVAGIATRLHRTQPGRFDVRYGAKHTDPSIEEAAAGLVGAGVDRVIGLVLAPHRSSLGSEEYLERAAAEIGRLAADVPFVAVRQWFDAPGFADLLADRVLAARSSLPADRGVETIVFTAHSLPERVVAAGDPYPEQLVRSAELVVDRAGLADQRQRDAGVTWQVAWQSAGRTPDPWLGPDVLDVIRGLPATGIGSVVVCPIGFVADHLEILYDLDVEARAVSDTAGVAFVRTASLNDDARFLDVLARVVEDAAEMAPPDRTDVAAGPTASAGPVVPTVGAAKDRRSRSRTVAIVGAGIAGLATAWELTGGREGPGRGTPAVVVLEASGRVGGKLRTEPFDGRPVDVGPDGFLGRRPEAAELCREVGLGDDLEPIGAAGAAVWSGGRRRALPAGQLLGVPTRFLPVARSGILGLRGNVRLLVDVLAPRPDLRGPLGDRAIGPLVAKKLGRRVVDRLVDPLVGGIYAGGVDDVSAAAAHPVLLAASQGRAGLMRSLRRSQAGDAGVTAATPTGDGPGEPTSPAPAFWALRGGLGALVDRLVTVLADRGVTVRTDCVVDQLDRGVDGAPAWSLHTADGDVVADAVVLAVPAAATADLLAAHDADAAALLRAIEYSSVALVTLAYPASAVGAELVGTGLLVPRHSPLPAALADWIGVGRKGDDGSFMVTACSYLSRKWPHLARPDELLLRASVGRFEDRRFTALNDEELVARVTAEVGVLLGIDGAPTTSSVTRWVDGLPQYRVHHLLRVTGIEAAVKRLPGLAVAGAAYRGVGVPACVASGRAAGRAVLTALGLGPSPVSPVSPGPVSPGP